MVQSSENYSLAALIQYLWQKKWFCIGFSGLFAVIAVVVALMIPNTYRSEMLLAPSQNQSSNMGLGSQLGGLASFAGISLEQGEVDNTTVALELLRSRAFALSVIDEYKMAVPLMAGDSYNIQTQTLAIDPEIYDVSASQWVRQVEPPKTPEPTATELYRAYLDIIDIERDQETGLIKVGVEFLSPVLAKKWNQAIVNDVNEKVRVREQSKFRQNIDYLQRQVESVENVELKTSLYQLLQEQFKSLMLTEVGGEYVLTTVDPAFIPDEKHAPARALIVILVTLLGGFLSVCLLTLRFVVK